MDERITDWRRPLLIAIVVVAAMFAAFTLTRNDATAAGTAQNPPARSSDPTNQTIQAAPEAQDRDGHPCPDKGGRGDGEQGSAPAPQQSAPATPATPGADL